MGVPLPAHVDKSNMRILKERLLLLPLPRCKRDSIEKSRKLPHRRFFAQSPLLRVVAFPEYSSPCLRSTASCATVCDSLSRSVRSSQLREMPQLTDALFGLLV